MRPPIVAKISPQQPWLVGAVLLPFLLQALLLGVSVTMSGTGKHVAISGVAPLLLGFVCLERQLRLRAAWAALLYVPTMYWLLAMFSLAFGGLVYGY